MGHLRVGRLPRSQKWREVIGLVAEGGSAAQVAEATVEAAEAEFTGADPAVVHAVWLLTQIPDAARSDDFAGALRALGIDVPAAPTAMDLASALGRAVENRVLGEHLARSDVGEMARLAAVETLARAVNERTPALFGTTSEDVARAVASLGTERQFGTFAREFFSRLTERVLLFHVSKELPFHVGEGQRFRDLDEQRAFQDSVALHARQAARIVEEFAGGWYSKARFERDLTPERTARFVAYAMKKMRDELRRGIG